MIDFRGFVRSFHSHCVKALRFDKVVFAFRQTVLNLITKLLSDVKGLLYGACEWLC